jgi:hypothetical protein
MLIAIKGGLDLTLEALRRFPKSAEIHETGCAALKALSANGETKEKKDGNKKLNLSFFFFFFFDYLKISTESK